MPARGEHNQKRLNPETVEEFETRQMLSGLPALPEQQPPVTEFGTPTPVPAPADGEPTLPESPTTVVPITPSHDLSPVAETVRDAVIPGFQGAVIPELQSNFESTTSESLLNDIACAVAAGQG